MNGRIFFLLAVYVFADTLTSVSVVPSSVIVRGNTTYSINISTKSTIPTGGWIDIVFPEIFVFMSGGVDCSAISMAALCVCSISGNTLKVTSCFPQLTSLVLLTIGSLANPLYAATGSFKIYTYSNSGSLLESKTSGVTVTYLPRTMSSGIITPVTSVASTISVWNIVFYLTYEIQTGGYVNITMPPGFCTGSITCTGVSNLNCYCNSGVTVILSQSLLGQNTLEVYSINNPNSTLAVNGFSISTGEVFGVVETIDGITVEVNQGGQMIINVQISDTQVFVNSEYSVEMYCPGPVSIGSDFNIQLPYESQVSPSSHIEGVFGLPSVLDYTISSNTIKILSGNTIEVSANNLISITISQISNPSSTKPTNPGIITITKSTGIICTGEFTLQASVGSLQVTITPHSNIINYYTTYEFIITTSNIFNNTYIQLQFPIDISTENASCAPCIKNFLILADSGNQISLTIENVKNGGIARTFTGFNFTSYIDENLSFAIEKNVDSSVNFGPGTMVVSIIPESKVTGDFTSYVFVLKINNTVPSGGDLEILFSSDFSISDLSASIIDIVNIASGYVLVLTETSVVVQNAFDAKFSGIVQFTVPFVQSPSSTRPCSIVCNSIFDGYYIDVTSVTLELSIGHEVKVLELSLSTTQVGAISECYFKLLLFNPVISKVSLTFPEIVSSPLCNYTCTGKESVLLIIESATPDQYIYFKISNIKNPSQTGSSQVFLSTFNGDYLSDTGIANIVITEPGLLQVIFFFRYNEKVGEFTNSTIQITTTNPVPSNGYITVHVTGGEESVCFYLTEIFCNYTEEYFNLYIFDLEFSGTTTFSIFNLLNSNNTTPFTITICTMFSIYFIDCGSISLTNTCTLPCTDCETTSNTCTQCVSPLFLYNNSCSSECLPGFYIENSECLPCNPLCPTCSSLTTCTSCIVSSPFNYLNTCVSTCPDPYYPNSDYICYKCLENCSACKSLSLCTSCSVGVLYSGTCQEKCPDNWFEINKICEKCEEFCEVCTGTEDCISCMDGYYLYNGVCVDTCPQGISILLERNCIDCQLPCGTCIGGISNCTSCESGSLDRNSCVDQCPDGFYSINSVCGKCQSICNTCTGTSVNCTSCPSGFFLYLNQCVSQCPQGSTPINNICSCPDHCDKCTALSCTSCSANYISYNGACLNLCPTGYFNYSNTCTTCPENCYNCTDLSTCTYCTEPFLLYLGNCYSECPNTTYADNFICKDCKDPCLYCNGSACTLCKYPLVLFEFSCIEKCPANYSLYFQECVENSEFCNENCTADMLDNEVCDSECNVKACEFDNGQCPAVNYTDTLDLKNLLLPLSIAGGVGLVTSTVSSIIFGSSVIAVSSSIISLLEGTSIFGLMGVVGIADGTHGRVALDIENTEVKLVFTLIFIINFLHFGINIAFALVFFKYLLPKDNGLRVWHKRHSCASRTFLGLSVVFSYKFFRLSTSGLFGLDCCNATLANPSNFSRPWVFMHYFTLTFISLPMLATICYIFAVFSQGSYVYLLAMDTGAIVLISLFFTVLEITCEARVKLKQTVSTPTETAEIDHKTYIEDLKNRFKIDSDRENESIILNLSSSEPQLSCEISPKEILKSTASSHGKNSEYLKVKHKESGFFILIRPKPWKLLESDLEVLTDFKVIRLEGPTRAYLEIGGKQNIGYRKIAGTICGIEKNGNWRFSDEIPDLDF